MTHSLLVSHSVLEHDSRPWLDFTRLTVNDSKAWTKRTIEELKDTHDVCAPCLPALSSVSTKSALVLFWTKVKTNISWLQLSTLCYVPKPTVGD